MKKNIQCRIYFLTLKLTLVGKRYRRSTVEGTEESHVNEKFNIFIWRLVPPSMVAKTQLINGSYPTCFYLIAYFGFLPYYFFWFFIHYLVL